MLDAGAVCTGRPPSTPLPPVPGRPGNTRPAQGLQGRVECQPTGCWEPTLKTRTILTCHLGLKLTVTSLCEDTILNHGRDRGALGQEWKEPPV